MSTVQGSLSTNLKNYVRLAQIHEGSNRYHMYNQFVVQEILQRDGDINYKVPDDSLIKLQNPSFLGNTALHFSVYDQCTEVSRILLNHGADFTIENHEGFTPLRLAIEASEECSRKYTTLRGVLKSKIVDLLLSTQVITQNPINPSCKDGISHFHIACMFNNVDAVKLFLSNGVSVHEAISMNSPRLPGYTPLHFAARYCCLETAEILLSHGADVQLKDAEGMSPLYLLIERNVLIIDTIDMEDSELFAIFIDELKNNERILNLLTKEISQKFSNAVDGIGLSCFHVACMQKYNPVTENVLMQNVNINAPVNFDAPICRGYTPLHFAANFNISTVILLLKNGANITIKDATGVTPFDICINRFKLEEILPILSMKNFNNILFSNNTKLLDMIAAMRNLPRFKKLLRNMTNVNVFIPLNSPLLPGYTPLHLTVVFAKSYKNMDALYDYTDYTFPEYDYTRPKYDKRVLACLDYGADLTIQDANGSTALHLAVQLRKRHIVDTILRYHKMSFCPVDQANVSHLRIACATNNKSLIQQLSLSEIKSPIKSQFKWYEGSDSKITSVQTGSTPLHISVAFKHKD